MDRTIRTIYGAWVDRKLPEVIPRDTDLKKYLDIRPRKVIVVTGFRRTGKTYLLYHLMNGLLEEHDRRELVHINFDDERIPPRTEFLSELLPSLKLLADHPMKYLFLDEIQDIPGWSKWLRRVHDSEPFEMFVTGSSSKVSSREIPTELRGRCLELRLYPLSFGEFLRFKDTGVRHDLLGVSPDERIKVRRMLSEYLLYGGMPEVVITPKERRFELLQQYFATVVARDITERHGVKNEEGLKALLRLLLNSTQYTITKLHNTLKSQGYGMGKNTIMHYLDHVEGSYFTHSLKILSAKVKDQMQYPRKVYFIDNGFINALSVRWSDNMGRLFENAVAVELLRRRDGETELHYWRDQRQKEVDFVVKRGTRVEELIQVSYDLTDPETKKREINSLVKAAGELGCDELLVVTDELELVEVHKGRTINFVPLWRWLLEWPGHRI